jgi:hypothetical protein
VWSSNSEASVSGIGIPYSIFSTEYG